MMSSFWIAVSVSLFSAMTYILFSVRHQKYQGTNESSESEPLFGNLRAKLIILLFLVLASSPVGYSFWGNMDKQESWQNAQSHFSRVVGGEQFTNNQNEIQQLVLSLRTAAAKDPENGQLWFMLANSYFQLRMIDLADAAMHRALRIEMRPDWLVANAQILSATNEESDIAKATNLLRSALSISPNHQGALLTLGFIYLRQQQYQQAITTWEKLKTLLETSGGNVVTLQKQIEVARQALEKQNK